jgi:hypothetical protein
MFTCIAVDSAQEGEGEVVESPLGGREKITYSKRHSWLERCRISFGDGAQHRNGRGLSSKSNRLKCTLETRFDLSWKRDGGKSNTHGTTCRTIDSVQTCANKLHSPDDARRGDIVSMTRKSAAEKMCR